MAKCDPGGENFLYTVISDDISSTKLISLRLTFLINLHPVKSYEKHIAILLILVIPSLCGPFLPIISLSVTQCFHRKLSVYLLLERQPPD